MPDTPLTCLDLWFRAGSSTERIGEEGLAHFLEHMVFKGSKSNLAGEFDRKIEALGGSSNAATGFDDVHFHVLVPPQVVLPALELLLDLVLKPALLPKAFEMEREVVLEEIAQHDDQPEEKVFQKLLSTCWFNHKYGRPILGCEKSLKASNPSHMKSFHDRLYTGENCCLSIAGVIPNNIEEIIENSLLSELQKASKENSSNHKESRPFFYKGHQELEVERLESSRLLIAWPFASAQEQLIVMGADIATSLLAEGRRSRLVQRLREDLRIVESIDMDVTVLEDGGLILLEACCQERYLKRVEQEVHSLLRDCLSTPAETQEMERAFQLVKNSLCFNLEATSQVAGLAGSHALWNRCQPLLEPLQNINYWSAERLRDEIFTKLQPQDCCTLIARPTKTDS